MLRPTFAFAALLCLTACATPEQRLRAGLVHAGLPEDLSACMAQDMAPRLTVKQLLRLRDLSRVSAIDPANTGVRRYLHQVRALGDGEIWTVSARAAARCAIGL